MKGMSSQKAVFNNGNFRMSKYPNWHGGYLTLRSCHAVEDDTVISKDGEVTAQLCTAARLSILQNIYNRG